jgi:hypothetical protein
MLCTSMLPGYYTPRLLSQFGTASGCLAVLVFALYINSDQAYIFYAQAEVIWLLRPIMLYWIGRVCLLVYRGQLHKDPV